MRLLVDTHILLWGLYEPDRLTERERAAIKSRSNQVFTSVVSVWEIAIKTSIGKLPKADDLPARLARNPDIEILPVRTQHAWRVRSIPRLHKDPFDILLIAQSLVEGLIFMTRDDWISKYEVEIFDS